MVLDDSLREVIMQKSSSAVLRRESIKRGMRTLREAGLLSIYDGITSIDEVVACTQTEE